MKGRRRWVAFQGDLPVWIHEDRYGGGYSGGAFTAWVCRQADCASARAEDDPRKTEPCTPPYGRAATPDEAVEKLMTRVEASWRDGGIPSARRLPVRVARNPTMAEPTFDAWIEGTWACPCNAEADDLSTSLFFDGFTDPNGGEVVLGFEGPLGRGETPAEARSDLERWLHDAGWLQQPPLRWKG